MASWAEFESAAPDLAVAAAARWPGIVALDRGHPVPGGGPAFAVAFLATTRPDGSPRLHPFCPVLAAGRLCAAIPARSPKGNDLRRDPRCVIHALPGPDDDELCIRAVAEEVTDDPGLRAAVHGVAVASGVGGMAETTAHDPLFAFDLVQVDVGHWVDVGQPGTQAVRLRWRP
jgi:Pyridoxamine 5'-phosphate oxidase